jgi:hypothetical protein
VESKRKTKLSKEEMLLYLNEINERLARDNKHGEILLVGGAALTLAFDARGFSKDIDAVFYPASDMQEIIADMANKHNLRDDWLNDDVRIYVTDKMNFVPFLEMSNLIVSSADAETLLALKLTAARDDFISSDLSDSVFLMKHLGIKHEAELFEIIEKHISNIDRKQNCKAFVMEAFYTYNEQR